MLAPEAVQRYDTSTRAADTRTRLAEAAKRKEEEERAAAAQRYQRKEYKTGRMTGGCEVAWLGDGGGQGGRGIHGDGGWVVRAGDGPCSCGLMRLG